MDNISRQLLNTSGESPDFRLVGSFNRDGSPHTTYLQLPETAQAGDLAIAMYSAGGQGIVTSTGWTLLESSAYKICTGGETSIDVNGNSWFNYGSTALFRASGGKQFAYQDTVGHSTTSGIGTQLSLPVSSYPTLAVHRFDNNGGGDVSSYPTGTQYFNSIGASYQTYRGWSKYTSGSSTGSLQTYGTYYYDAFGQRIITFILV